MRLGILGAGGIARAMTATIRGMAREGEDVELYAVASRDQGRAEAFAAKEGVAHAFGSYEAMLEDPLVDLVYIATPHSHHAGQMSMCAGFGKPVLTEKAFTANAAQAREELERFEGLSLLATGAIWTRYMPSRAMLRQLIESGVIGDVTALTCNLGYAIDQVERIRRPELAGGALLDVGVYCLNFAAMVLGDQPLSVSAQGILMDTGVDLTDTITLVYDRQVVASLFTTARSMPDRSGVVYGTKGYIRVENINNPSRLEVWKPEESTLFPSQILPVPRQITGYEYEVRACMQALRDGRTECPDMPHQETIRIMEQMDAIRSQLGVVYPFDPE